MCVYINVQKYFRFDVLEMYLVKFQELIGYYLFVCDCKFFNNVYNILGIFILKNQIMKKYINIFNNYGV